MFPSILNTFNIPTATDRLNSPSHSALHNTVSSALGQVEAVIGRDGNNSVAGTLIYQIRSADSDGGGHIQTANKGGTGQTTYNKGDILSASSSSVLAKLAVGLDGQVLVADSSVASGVKWGASGNRLYTSASVITYNNSVEETSLFSVSIPGSTLGTLGAIRTTLDVGHFQQAGGSSILIRVNYAGNAISSVLLNPQISNVLVGKIEHTMVANNATNAQRGVLLADINKQRVDAQEAAPSVLGIWAYITGTTSVNSSANNVYGITARNSRNDAAERIDITQIIVEKIT